MSDDAELNQYYSAIIESSTDAIITKSPEGVIRSWNAAAQRMFGYGPAEVIGHPITLLSPADRLPEEAEFLRRLALGERIEHFETVRVRKDGVPIALSVTLSPILDAAGRLMGVSTIARDITDTRRADARLRAQEKLLRITLSSIGDAVIAADDAARVTFANPVAEALTGWIAAEAEGKPLTDVFHIVNEQTRAPVENPVAKVLREGRVVGLANHTVLIDRHGREHPIDDSAAPIHDDENDKVLGVVMVFRDVTERRRYEEGLLRLAAIVESSDDAIVTKTLEGIITSWNPGAERMFGYSAAEAVGRPMTMVFPPERFAEEVEFLRRLAIGERVEHFETERIRKDGQRLHVSVSLSPLTTQAGAIIGVATIARDITVPKRREAALSFSARASEVLSSSLDLPATLRRVAEFAVPDFADGCSVDLVADDGSIERVAIAHRDPAVGARLWEAAKRFARSPNHPIVRVVVTGQAQMCTEVTEAMRAGLSDDPEYVAMLNAPWFRSYVVVPMSVKGRVIGVISFIVGDGRRYTPVELALAEDLGRRAAQAVENARLYREAEAANEAKDHFLAMLAHELRDPLGVMLSSVSVVEQLGGVSGDVAKASAMIRRQGAHLARLLDDLLDVARISQGKIDLHVEGLDLRDVAELTLEGYRPAIAARGQSVALELPSSPVPVLGDAARLQQVIGNLLGNASKYTPSGGSIRLTVASERGQAVLRVWDSGIGIPPDRLETIFELFAQLDPTLARTEGGLGLGLTLARRLVELHGGTVRAHSEGRGRGSEFEVRLPLAALAPWSEREPAAVTGLAPRRLLLIEDNEDAREVAGLALRLQGHDVHGAGTGREGIELASRIVPDVVIVDIGLPDLDGYEVGRHLRGVLGKAVRLIAVTGYGQPDDRRRTAEAGFDLHLVKPVDPDTLLRALG
jgi:PAS domain S-box-containing protein